MQTCEFANMCVCSGLLIGRSAPPQMSMHGAGGRDTAHGETTSWGRHNVDNEGPAVRACAGVSVDKYRSERKNRQKNDKNRLF